MSSRNYRGESIPIRPKVVLPISLSKDKGPSPANNTWEFVNISQPDRGNNAELRRSVRSNAMRHYHSEQRARKRKLEHQRELCKKESSTLVLEEPEARITKPHGGSEPVQPLAVCVYPCPDQALGYPTPPGSPYTRLGNGDSDPFSSLPVQDSPLDSWIFHHCKSPLDWKH